MFIISASATIFINIAIGKALMGGGEGGDNPMAGMMSMFGGMMGGAGNGEETKADSEE